MTREAMPGVQVWYARAAGRLTLGLTTPDTQKLIPDEAIPPGATRETSRRGTIMYRYDAPVLALEEPPEDQPGAPLLVARIEGAFEWFNATRTDKK
ncbi:MAG: hypothetical protein AAFW69_01815 [Pseudomonadota bacterium]